jgi:lipopolysaccharide/colanic/teichoic acid biosynthesis glycosyltransferase
LGLSLVLRRASLARALGASRSIAGFIGALKRLSDIALASVGLLIAFPAMLWIAAVAKVQDGGPAIFRQVRVGRDGKPFTMLKFRTMVVDAEARQADLIALSDGHGAFFKLRHDPRITVVGRFLREFSLDELPQLFNVLNGSMSLVGPRPHLRNEAIDLPVDRVKVRPGLTGLWQTSGRSDLHADDATRLDLEYVKHWSLWLDFKIMIRTMLAVLLSAGTK